MEGESASASDAGLEMEVVHEVQGYDGDRDRCCKLSYYDAIYKFLRNNKAALKWLREHGVLVNEEVSCEKCGQPCTYREIESGVRVWRCNTLIKIPKTKKKKRCEWSMSETKGTFLQQARIPAWKIVLFVNHFLQKMWSHDVVIHNLGITMKTSVDWRSFCSEVTESWFDFQEPIGGGGLEVEIDETLLTRRKYERGRFLHRVWLFGGIERASKRRFVVALNREGKFGTRRDKKTLVPIIQKFIKPGSVIYSDFWKSYERLAELPQGYRHHRINHSKNFVDPQQKHIHTQNIERLWRDIKEYVKRPGIRAEYLSQYLARYMFIKSVPNQDNLLHAFFERAALLYPPRGDAVRRPVNPRIEDPDSGDEWVTDNEAEEEEEAEEPSA